jgi:hypothetical protein
MISAEAPILFAKACEMFILELTLRSWYQTEEFKRRTLQVRRWSGVSLTRLAVNRYGISSMPPVCAAAASAPMCPRQSRIPKSSIF